MTKKKKLYAVAVGRNVGIYKSWKECEQQTKGFPGARFKSFTLKLDAEVFVEQYKDKSKEDDATSAAAAAAAATTTAVAPALPASYKRATSIAADDAPNCCRHLTIHIHFDGGARGNPGIAGCGAQVVLKVLNNNIDGRDGHQENINSKTIHIRKYLHHATNNVAEYHGALCGLQRANLEIQKYVASQKKQNVSYGHHRLSAEVHVKGDSNVIIKQLDGSYKCKANNLIPLYNKAKIIFSQIRKNVDNNNASFKFDHVRRKDNTIAHKLANEAMDQQRSWVTEESDTRAKELNAATTKTPITQGQIGITSTPCHTTTCGNENDFDNIDDSFLANFDVDAAIKASPAAAAAAKRMRMSTATGTTTATPAHQQQQGSSLLRTATDCAVVTNKKDNLGSGSSTNDYDNIDDSFLANFDVDAAIKASPAATKRMEMRTIAPKEGDGVQVLANPQSSNNKASRLASMRDDYFDDDDLINDYIEEDYVPPNEYYDDTIIEMIKDSASGTPARNLSSTRHIEQSAKLPQETKTEKPSIPSSAFSDRTYSSVAHKMMAKMGHVEGKGLGKNKQGITSPVKESGNRGGHGIGYGKEKLNKLQAEAVELAKKGENVFITGPGGTGKSVVLRHIMKYLKENYKDNEYVAVAPTGPTAIAVGGQTIHSFAGCGVPETVDDFNKCWDKKKQWTSLRVMVVEEVSMISGEFFDRLSDIASKMRYYNNRPPNPKPYGGIQLIVSGDFLQLPPISKPIQKVMAEKKALAAQGNNDVELHQDRGFAFQSRAWKAADFSVIQLDQIFRQSNTNFVSVLRDIRMGKVSDEAVAFLKQCDRPLPPNKDGIYPTILYSKNIDVDEVNNGHLRELPGDTYPFDSYDGVELLDYNDPNAADTEELLWSSNFFKNCIAEKQLRLKVGAQVMLIKNERQDDNQDVSKRLVNGSRGKVIGFTNVPDADAGDSQDDEIDYADCEGGNYPIVLFQNNRRKEIVPERFESRLVGLGTCYREAIPLKLAWAVTIHKSQGLTLDCLKADLKGVFAEAQTYVALSRATDENGLELRNFSKMSVKVNKKALAFYSNPTGSFPGWDEPWEQAVEFTKEINNRDNISSVAPEGKPMCLDGLAFVFTGEFAGSYSRNQAEALVRECGGNVRGAVSGKTNYVVIGSMLDDGRDVQTSQKYQKAKQIVNSGNNKSNLKIITKNDLFKIIRHRSTLVPSKGIKNFFAPKK